MLGLSKVLELPGRHISSGEDSVVTYWNSGAWWVGSITRGRKRRQGPSPALSSREEQTCKLHKLQLNQHQTALHISKSLHNRWCKWSEHDNNALIQITSKKWSTFVTFQPELLHKNVRKSMKNKALLIMSVKNNNNNNNLPVSPSQVAEITTAEEIKRKAKKFSFKFGFYFKNLCPSEFFKMGFCFNLSHIY